MDKMEVRRYRGHLMIPAKIVADQHTPEVWVERADLGLVWNASMAQAEDAVDRLLHPVHGKQYVANFLGEDDVERMAMFAKAWGGRAVGHYALAMTCKQFGDAADPEDLLEDAVEDAKEAWRYARYWMQAGGYDDA